ncbi:MAG TPA: hypothetical protein VHQ70_06625 [Syntrophomonadaceae bacterium]|nr:hypothetical protein [Syntrophomonadaceae bacterium]
MGKRLYRGEIRPGQKRFKTILVKIVLFVLGRGFQCIAARDEIVKKEVAGWKESLVIMFQILPCGPYMSLQKKNGRLCYMGLTKSYADLVINFKNIETAFMVFTAQIGIPEGYAQHRFSVEGDISQAMSVIRCLNMVEFYLFPRFIAKLILKRVPGMTAARFGLRLYTYFVGIPLGL